MAHPFHRPTRVGTRVLINAGWYYWAESTEDGPDDWGGRFAVTLLFPK